LDQVRWRLSLADFMTRVCNLKDTSEVSYTFFVKTTELLDVRDTAPVIAAEMQAAC